MPKTAAKNNDSDAIVSEIQAEHDKHKAIAASKGTNSLQQQVSSGITAVLAALIARITAKLGG